MNINIEEIKAREQAATKGPWINDVRVGCVAVYSGEKANCIDETEDRRLFFAKGKMVLDKGINFDHWETEPQDIKNAAFISHARTDIPALIAEVERLTAENELNSAYAECYKSMTEKYGKNFAELLDKAKALKDENISGKETNKSCLQYIKTLKKRIAAKDGQIEKLTDKLHTAHDEWQALEILSDGEKEEIATLKKALGLIKVIHAHWIKHIHDVTNAPTQIATYECSQCGYEGYDTTHGCPNCRALMDEKDGKP